MAQPVGEGDDAVGTMVALTGSVGRFYNEPIGPPTEPISLNSSAGHDTAAWVEQAEQALERMEQELDAIVQGSIEVEASARCDVSDLREQVSRWHGNAYYREELKKWTQRRIYYGGVEPPPDKRALDANGEQDLQIGDSGEVDLANEGRASAAKKRKIATTKKGKGKGKTKGKNTQGDEADDLDEDDFVLDEEVRKLTEEAAGKELAILEPWDADFYTRKTKTADVNCLAEIRPTFEPAPPPAPLDDSVDPLSNVILTITFHPISKFTRRIYTSPQQQVIICLASNTLGQLRDNLTAGGDGIPREIEPKSEDHEIARGEDDDDDEEEEPDQNAHEMGEYGVGEMDEMGTIASATRKRITGHFGDGQDGDRELVSTNGRRLDENGKEIVEWSDKRRVTGACFGIDGVFYPDLKGEGKTDYARMLLDAIDSTKWSHKNGTKFTPRRPPRARGSDDEDGSEDDEDDDSDQESTSSVASAVNPRSNDISVHSTPAPPDFDSNIDPILRDGYSGGVDDFHVPEPAVIMDEEEHVDTEPRPEDPHKPKYVEGPAMHATKLGDIPLRVGQPYWFVHQGNYEQVWTIDSIRSRHPSDPALTSPHSNHPYPLTTYLSRQLSHKCHICDRDPATLFLIDDYSASENPSHVCQGCFDCLHPEIPTERDFARAKRREERQEEKRVAREERMKELLREQRRLKRKSKPKDDDSVGSGGENELPEFAPIELEDDDDDESEDEDSGPEEVRVRKYVDGVRIVPTVIEQ